MNFSNASRQIGEITTIKEQWYAHAIEISTPTLYQRLHKLVSGTSSSSSSIIKAKKTLSFVLHCKVLHHELSNLVLSIEFPVSYPSDELCSVRANHADTTDEFHACTVAINLHLQHFLGCDCLEIILEWLAENKSTCLVDTEVNGETKDSSDAHKNDELCLVLRYNHLLSGSEHKKEKTMLDLAKKSKLHGGLLWGTPGIVVFVPPTTADEAKEYASECRSIGKRADGVEEIWLPRHGIEEAGLSGMAQLKRGIGKLKQMETATLRLACDGDEGLLRRILGIH